MCWKSLMAKKILAPKTSKEKQYGDQRRKWSPEFGAYMQAVVRHPNFAGMPDAIDEDQTIRWNAPSNRPPGKWQDLRDRRLAWWAKKADALGIPKVGGWISKAAKKNHPFGKKPCQTCGRSMLIEYAYPTRKTIKRLNTVLSGPEQLAYEDYETIYDIIPRVLKNPHEVEGFDVLVAIFPEFQATERSEDAYVDFMQKSIVPIEPRGRLSPGAMANPPDRLDGFHSYDLCCRPTQDTGRSAENLRTYSDDRRAFEYWCEGDWAAANMLMALGDTGKCPECGRTEKMTADHIGPISLGFTHRPRFKPLCSSCNSTKGNRLTLSDVRLLIEDEKKGEQVASFHISALWNACKGRVKSEEDAKKLGNLLRINQHYYLESLMRIFNLGYPDLLLGILGANYAQEKIEFVDLNAATFGYGRITKTKRADTYSDSKACRAIKVGFEALGDYSLKENRNIHAVPNEVTDQPLKELLATLPGKDDPNRSFRGKLGELLREKDLDEKEKMQKLGGLLDGDYEPRAEYPDFKKALKRYLDAIGVFLAKGL